MSPEWQADFRVFLADMGTRPPGTQLERRDNNGPYSKANCYWATRKQQMRNTRRTRLIVWKGIAQTLGAWATGVGIPESALYYRLTHGWSVEDTLTTPSRKTQNPK